MPVEGVTKFRQEFKEMPPIKYNIIRELNLWRNALHREGLIGHDPNRYDGADYGNVSQLLKPYNHPRDKRRFVITGTQTGHLVNLTEKNYTIVAAYYPKENLVFTEGPVKASSESMTHGIIYDLDDSIRFVFHVHCPYIWQRSKELLIPTTSQRVEYGTPEMAEEVERLYKETDLPDLHIFSMGGHEDGIIAFGSTLEDVGSTIAKYLGKDLDLIG